MTVAPSLDRPTTPPRRWGGRLLPLLCAAVVVVLGFGIAVYVHHLHRGGWELKFNENFSGSGVSSDDWNIRNNTYLPYEKSVLTSRPQNVSVSDGALDIVARREPASVGDTHRDYTSGYLDTIGKHSWKYGRFEMRAKLPASVGLWPAFWLRADHGLGEVDIMEAIGGMPTFAHQAVHQSTNGGQGKFENNYTLPAGSTAEWHVYGVDLEPNSITWTIDGTKVFTVTAKQAPWITTTFDQSMNIRLNLQVGGTFPNYYNHPLTASSQFPAQFTIDWIRVYQRR